MMRIAHIVSTYPPYFGGMGNVVFQIANQLSNLGHEVEVFTPDYGTQVSNSKKDFAKRIKPTFKFGNAATIPQILHELSKFDVVHLHYPFFGTADLVRKWKKEHRDIPLVITYFMDTIGSGWKGLLFKCYESFRMPKILASADLLICSSFEYLETSQAREIFRTNRNKWIELPYGVDTKRFRPRPKSQEFYAQYSLSEDLPTVLFVGGMDSAHYFKGIRVLLRAIQIAKQYDAKFQTLLVGDGNLRAGFEKQAIEIGIADHTRFVGRVSENDLPYYYNLADVLVLPSITRGEAFGLVLLEAFASGIPVIASDLPGVRSIASQAGTVVPPNDPEALARAIQNFIESDTTELRQRAREVVLSKYQWGQIVVNLAKHYEDLRLRNHNPTKM